MRINEIITEDELNEIDRRGFLSALGKGAAATAIAGSGLGGLAGGAKDAKASNGVRERALRDIGHDLYANSWLYGWLFFMKNHRNMNVGQYLNKFAGFFKKTGVDADQARVRVGFDKASEASGATLNVMLNSSIIPFVEDFEKRLQYVMTAPIEELQRKQQRADAEAQAIAQAHADQRNEMQRRNKEQAEKEKRETDIRRVEIRKNQVIADLNSPIAQLAAVAFYSKVLGQDAGPAFEQFDQIKSAIKQAGNDVDLDPVFVKHFNDLNNNFNPNTTSRKTAQEALKSRMQMYEIELKRAVSRLKAKKYL